MNRHWSRTTAILVGLMSGVGIFGLNAAWLLDWEVDGIEHRHSHVVNSTNEITNEITLAVNALTAEISGNCTESQVTKMNALRLKFVFIAGLSVIDPNGRVECSIGLSMPAKSAGVDFRSQPGESQILSEIAVNDSGLTVIAVILGRVGVTLSPLTIKLLTDDVDAGWIEQKGGATLLHVDSDRSDEQVTAMRRAFESGSARYIDWSSGTLVLTLHLEDNRFVIQSIVPLGEWAWPRLLPVLLLSALLGLAIWRRLSPR